MKNREIAVGLMGQEVEEY